MKREVANIAEELLHESSLETGVMRIYLGNMLKKKSHSGILIIKVASTHMRSKHILNNVDLGHYKWNVTNSRCLDNNKMPTFSPVEK